MAQNFHVWNAQRPDTFVMQVRDYPNEPKLHEFVLELYPDVIEKMVQKAIRNKSRKSVDGPVKVKLATAVRA